MSKWMEGVDRWPRALPSFDFEPDSSALLLIDMQNFCASKDCGLGPVLKERFPDMYEYYCRRLDLVMENSLKLLDYFRGNGMRVIFTTTGPILEDASDYFTPRRERDRQMQLQRGVKTNFPQGTWQAALRDEFVPIQGKELVVHKTSTAAFNSSGIDLIRRKMRVETLIVTGVATNACVEMTARDAADRWYKVVMVEDAQGTFSEEAHISTLRNFARLYGMVWSTGEVIEYLSKKRRGERSNEN